MVRGIRAEKPCSGFKNNLRMTWSRPEEEPCASEHFIHGEIMSLSPIRPHLERSCRWHIQSTVTLPWASSLQREKKKILAPPAESVNEPPAVGETSRSLREVRRLKMRTWVVSRVQVAARRHTADFVSMLTSSFFRQKQHGRRGDRGGSMYFLSRYSVVRLQKCHWWPHANLMHAAKFTPLQNMLC